MMPPSAGKGKGRDLPAATRSLRDICDVDFKFVVLNPAGASSASMESSSSRRDLAAAVNTPQPSIDGLSSLEQATEARMARLNQLYERLEAKRVAAEGRVITGADASSTRGNTGSLLCGGEPGLDGRSSAVDSAVSWASAESTGPAGENEATSAYGTASTLLCGGEASLDSPSPQSEADKQLGGDDDYDDDEDQNEKGTNSAAADGLNQFDFCETATSSDESDSGIMTPFTNVSPAGSEDDYDEEEDEDEDGEDEDGEDDEDEDDEDQDDEDEDDGYKDNDQLTEIMNEIDCINKVANAVTTINNNPSPNKAEGLYLIIDRISCADGAYYYNPTVHGPGLAAKRQQQDQGLFNHAPPFIAQDGPSHSHLINDRKASSIPAVLATFPADHFVFIVYRNHVCPCVRTTADGACAEFPFDSIQPVSTHLRGAAGNLFRHLTAFHEYPGPGRNVPGMCQWHKPGVSAGMIPASHPSTRRRSKSDSDSEATVLGPLDDQFPLGWGALPAGNHHHHTRADMRRTVYQQLRTLRHAIWTPPQVATMSVEAWTERERTRAALVDYMQHQALFADDFARYEAQIPRGKTDAESWTCLFGLGDVVVGRTRVASGVEGLAAFVLTEAPALVRAGEAVFPQSEGEAVVKVVGVYSAAGAGVTRAVARGWRYAFDGEKLFRQMCTLVIDDVLPVGREVSIADLGLCPLRYAMDKVREGIRRRGERFWELRREQVVAYEGWDWGKKEYYPADSRFVLDCAAFYKKIGRRPGDKIECEIPTWVRGKDLWWPRSIPSNQPTEYLMDGTLLIAAEVPAFCLTKKKWVKLPVDGLSPVQWDTNAFDKLILPPELVDFCTTVVSPRVSASKASSKEGLGPVSPPVVHLRGPTGTGKTATARAIAEQAQRPLYHLKFSELSDKFSDARSMLQAVEDILRAGAAWKAVLLIDKVDGALEHHRELDLEDLGEDIREMVDSVVDMLKAYPGIVMVETRPPNAAADDSSKKIEQQMKPLVKGTLTFPPLSAEARAAVYKRDIYRLMKAGGQLPSGMSWSEFQDTAEAQLPHPEAWGVLHRWPAAMDGHQILRLARTIFHVVTAPGWVADQEALALVLWTVTRRFRSGKDSDTNQEEKGWLWGTDKASELSKRMVKLLKTEKFFAADKREMLMEQAMGMWDDIERRWKDVELCPDEEESDVMALEFMVETAERLDNTEDWFVTLIEASLDKRQDCKLWAVDAARQVVRQLLDEHESAVAEMNEKHVAEIDTRFGEMARVVNGGMKWRNGTQMTPLDWFMVDATREELQREFQNANSLVRKHAEETQAEITRLKERIDELLWQVKEAIEEGEDDDEDEDEDEDEEGDDENE